MANVIAAMYIACGQDAACVAEGQVGLARFEVTEKVRHLNWHEENIRSTLLLHCY